MVLHCWRLKTTHTNKHPNPIYTSLQEHSRLPQLIVTYPDQSRIFLTFTYFYILLDFSKLMFQQFHAIIFLDRIIPHAFIYSFLLHHHHHTPRVIWIGSFWVSIHQVNFGTGQLRVGSFLLNSGHFCLKRASSAGLLNRVNSLFGSCLGLGSYFSRSGHFTRSHLL